MKCCFFSSFQWPLVLSALWMRKQSRAAEFPLEAKTACCHLLRWRAKGQDAAVRMGVFILQQGVHCKISLQSVEMKIETCAAETCADWRKVCAKWKDKRFNARETVIVFFKKVLDECWNDEIKQTHQYIFFVWQIFWDVWVCPLYYLTLSNICSKILEECVSVRLGNDIVIIFRYLFFITGFLQWIIPKSMGNLCPWWCHKKDGFSSF